MPRLRLNETSYELRYAIYISLLQQAVYAVQAVLTHQLLVESKATEICTPKSREVLLDQVHDQCCGAVLSSKVAA